jgi:hypothetical protein
MEPEEPTDKVWHIYPVMDVREHDTENGSRCSCIPVVWVDGDGITVVSHNSFDGREWQEADNVRLN